MRGFSTLFFFFTVFHFSVRRLFSICILRQHAHWRDLLHPRAQTHNTKYSCSTPIPHTCMYPLNFTLNVSRQPQSCCTTVSQSVSVVGCSLIILFSNRDHYSSHRGVALPTCMRQQYICQYLPEAVRYLFMYCYYSLLWECILLFARGNHFSCFGWALQRHNKC